MLNCNTIDALQSRLDNLMSGKEVVIGKNKYYIIGSTKIINKGKVYYIMINDLDKAAAFIYWHDGWVVNHIENINDVR